MTIRRVALIFDDRRRPDTTGVHLRRALAELVAVVHFPPEPADTIPRTGFDLYLSIDDDTEHRLPADLHPRAYWSIDTHREFAARLRRSAGPDLVFAAQRDGAARLPAAGIDSATWLPLACDPGIHRRHDVPKQYDVAFAPRAPAPPATLGTSPGAGVEGAARQVGRTVGSRPARLARRTSTGRRTHTGRTIRRIFGTKRRRRPGAAGVWGRQPPPDRISEFIRSDSSSFIIATCAIAVGEIVHLQSFMRNSFPLLIRTLRRGASTKSAHRV
jgi:hypothetical protein